MRCLRLSAALATMLVPWLWNCAASEKTDPNDPGSQIAQGARVFTKKCAECHGTNGQGTKDAPQLVGAGALPREPRPGQERNVSFFTAQDVANFVLKNMPPFPDERALIPESDHWAVVAFALDANGVDLDEPLGPRNAGKIMLHP
jgi:cytochrome c